MNISIIELKETDSTNTYLKKIVEKNNVPEGTIVITKKQIKGKGQRTNKWESEEGKNLTFSLLLKPNIHAEQVFMVSKAVSLGIVDAISEFNAQFTIKWPNDIYYKNKKLAGILIENQFAGDRISHAIIGIGININQEKFISDAPNPISLKNITNKEFDLKLMLDKIINKIVDWYNVLENNNIDKINETYHKYLYRRTDYHSFKTEKETIQAKIIEVKDDGELILETAEKQQMGFYFNEINFVL